MSLTETAKLLPSLPDYSEDWAPQAPWYEYQMCEHGGLGVISQYGGNSVVNEAAYYFMFAQFKMRAGRGVDEDLLDWCWNFAFQAVDQVDPYILFHGCTDVIKTDRTYYNQFSIREEEHHYWSEVSGESAEHFELFPEGVQAYDVLMSRPGLQEYFDTIHDYFDDHISWYTSAEGSQFKESDEYYLINKYGPKTKDLMHLGVWAALMWMISPEEDSREWRAKHHPIFDMCYSEGSCFLHDWRFYPPTHYKMDHRPLQSCAECGAHEDCVELVQVVRTKAFRYICQSCQSDNTPFPGMICGTTMCTRVECHNHPAHTTDLVAYNDPLARHKASRAKRMLEADARYGELEDIGYGVKVRELPGMVHINQKVIQHYSNSITSDLGKVLDRLLSPPK